MGSAALAVVALGALDFFSSTVIVSTPTSPATDSHGSLGKSRLAPFRSQMGSLSLDLVSSAPKYSFRASASAAQLSRKISMSVGAMAVAEKASEYNSAEESLLPSEVAGDSIAEEFTGYQPWGGNDNDTAGAVLQVEALTLSAGGRDLISAGEWRLMHGEHARIIGVDGSGKSSLLHAVVGVSEIQSGSIKIALGTEVAYLEQTVVSSLTRTMWQEVGSRMLAFKVAMQELEASKKVVENALAEKEVEHTVERLGKAQEWVEALDGY